MLATKEPVRFRFRRSRARPAVQLVDLMAGNRAVATVIPTDDGFRIVSHDRPWTKPKWSGKQPMAVEVEFAPEGK